MTQNHATRRHRHLHRLALLPSCLRAIGELALARLRHLSLKPRDIIALNTAARGCTPSARDVPTSPLLARIAFVMPRIAARLPWRADCLVQALAAQRWLRSNGLASQISIGVDRTADGEFAAHAWLMHEGQIVTGGEISRFNPLLTPDSHD